MIKVSEEYFGELRILKLKKRYSEVLKIDIENWNGTVIKPN